MVWQNFTFWIVWWPVSAKSCLLFWRFTFIYLFAYFFILFYISLIILLYFLYIIIQHFTRKIWLTLRSPFILINHFTNCFFQHKWNGAWLLIIKMVHKYCLPSCRTNVEDLLVCCKFHYRRRRIWNPVEHLLWSFFCENSEQLKIVN